MQAQIERRAHAQRVPMDHGVVEVSFVEYGETAPADAVNIAEGGLSLRASILPEVGTEMRCSFPMPDGQSIEAECQVVWAQHSGPYAGEFGLRFTDLARLDEERIRDYVDAHRAHGEWQDSSAGGGSVDDSDPGYVDDSDPGYAARVADSYEPSPPTKHPAIPDTIRLFIDGVSSPVAAKVVQATNEALVVEQALPFLRLGTRIAAVEGGPKGSLVGVALRVVDGAPKLVLTVQFGGETEAVEQELELAIPEPVHSDVAYAKTELRSPLDTLPDVEDGEGDSAVDATPEEQAGAVLEDGHVSMALEDARHSSVPPARIVDARPSRSPSDMARAARAEVAFARPDDDDDEDDEDENVVVALGALAEDVSQSELDDLDELLSAPHVADREPMRPGRADTRDPASRGHAPAAADEVPDALGDSPVDRLSLLLQTRSQQLGARTAPLRARGRALLAGGLKGLLPALRLLWARTLQLAVTLRTKAKPTLRALGRRTQNTVAQLRGHQARRTTTSGRPLRRQQSRVGATVRPGAPRAQHETSAALDPQRARRRAIALSALAFSLVALTVWALVPSAEEPAEVDAPPTTARTPSEPLAAAPAPATDVAVSPYVAPAAPAPAPAAAVAAAPVPPGPTPGPLAEPTYPSLGDERPQAPGSVPGDSPYAEGGAEQAPMQEGRSFGADTVGNARRFEISMSQPVENVRGRAESNGFVVDIPGSLAMGGARTISRNHPSVARSHILNHGTYSTLTVEFVAGQSPAYRVSGRGATLQIEIAR
ncbi:MAG: PilZ domain-containing protein [Polyangiales bacterium]